MPRIGQSPPRPDGWAKVAGEARYADDFTLPGMLYGATVRSPHPHAEILAVERPVDPEAVCVTAADLPGPNGVQLIDDSWPILAAEQVRHVGEPVVLVAAESRLAAARLAAEVKVTYRPRPADLTPADSAEVLTEVALTEGDLEAAFSEAPYVVEGLFETGHQEHIYIECNAMTAWFEEDGTLVVVGSMQCPYYVHKSLVHAFGLPDDSVRVQATTVGGGFGGKEDFPSVIALHAALLARASGRPVRIAYDRHEDIVGTTKRHPAIVRHRTAVAEDGRLLAMDIDLTFDGGAYRTLSPVVLSRALLHSWGPYRCPVVRVRGRAMATHTPPNGAFRGFGAPQVEFAIERQIDRVARRLGLDPLSVRRLNAVEAGDRLPTGQELDPTTSAVACLERASELTGFNERWRQLEAERAERADGEPLRGVGLTLFFHGAGFTGNGERRMRSPVTARLAADGRVEVLSAMTDMGQGAVAVFPQIAASASGLAPADFVFAPPDTSRVPDSGPTVASRTTMVVGGTIAKATRELSDRLARWWGGEEATVEEGTLSAPGRDREPFVAAARRYLATEGPLVVTLRHEPPAHLSFDDETYRGAAYPTYAWGCNVVEVEVDPDTLATRPIKVTSVCEVGRAIHPTLCAGQIEGGTLQAVGWALSEEMALDEGRYQNDRLATYIIPTALDSPEIEVHLLERPWEGGPFGAKGVGELPMDGAAPAVAQAIENATGLSVERIPATPERLFTAGPVAEGPS